ncbi:hypothetical protein [Streptomyces fungicidicus]
MFFGMHKRAMITTAPSCELHALIAVEPGPCRPADRQTSVS